MRAALIVLAAIVAILGGAVAAGGQEQAPPVWVISLEGTIDPVNATFVERRLDDAAEAGAAVAILRMDTPGGFDASMREIVSAMRAADVDVAVWVGPSGARAGSAGAYIAAASDHLGMAPGTNIGSATPIGGAGGEDLDAKIRGDAAAFIAALAQESGRNAAAYRAMVDDAANYTAAQAVDRGVAETAQPTLEAFVAWLDGREGRDGARLATAGAPLQERDLPWYLRALQVLIDPNLVFILLLLGLAGLGYEIFNPGAIIPGVAGGIALLLALAGLSVLPFTWAGLALIALAVALFVAETQVAGVGALAAGGVVALALGGAFLFDGGPGLEPSLPFVIATATVIGGGFAVAAHLAMRARGRPVATGGGALVGETGEARAAIGPGGGRVFVNGELWSARAANGTEIPAGTRVRVVRVDDEGLTLTVEPGEE